MNLRNKIVILAGVLFCAGGVVAYTIVTAATPQSLCEKLQKGNLVTQCENGITITLLKDLPRYKERWSFQPQGETTSGTIIQFETDDDLQHAKQVIQDSNSGKRSQIDVFKAKREGAMKRMDADDGIVAAVAASVLESDVYNMYTLPHRILVAVPGTTKDDTRTGFTKLFGYPE